MKPQFSLLVSTAKLMSWCQVLMWKLIWYSNVLMIDGTTSLYLLVKQTKYVLQFVRWVSDVQMVPEALAEFAVAGHRK